MDALLNIQSQFYNKFRYKIKDIILPRKKYEKRTKQMHICHNNMENRRFGKEIRDINNLTEIQNQSNSQISRIGEILLKLNKDADKSINRSNNYLGYKIPPINRIIKNKKITNLIKVNINNNQIMNNSTRINYHKSSRHYIIDTKNNYFDTKNFNSLKDINSNSKLNLKKLKRNSAIFKKIRKNSNIKTEDSKNHISFNNIQNNHYMDECKRINLKKFIDKENYNTINLTNNNSFFNKKKNIKYEKRTQENESYIMKFIRKQYKLPKEKERNINLSLNNRHKSKKKEYQNEINHRKSHLNFPKRIIPITKNTSGKYNFKSNNLYIIYPKNENPQIPKEYINDIYKHLNLIEYDDLPLKNYINIIQTDINEKMRLILLDWLVEVHIKFNLLTETLFITISIIDKYLSKKNIHRKYLQLLGITSLLIACKYEEIYPPQIKKLIHMTDNAYNKNQVLKMEYQILDILNFNISFPTSLKFLEIFKNRINLDDKDFYRCLYFIEVCLIDYKSSFYNPSLIAATSLYFNFINKNGLDKLECDEKNIFNITGYSRNDVNDCLLCLNNAMKNLEKNENKYNSIRRKFQLDKYLNVGNEKYFIEENKLEKITNEQIDIK